MHTYIAYGIIVKSVIPLNSLFPFNGIEGDDFITVKLGEVPSNLLHPAEFENEIFSFNENEFLYFLPGKLKMYIKDGKEIMLEPLCTNIEDALLYFYCNGLAAAVFQRKLIPFHVSGVFLNESEVLLIAAPSGTGKSTTAVKLQEYGYPFFTDDTAIISSENGQIYAEASYPMVRLWKKSIERQAVFDLEEKLHIYADDEYEKYGFNFHTKFAIGKFKVKGFVFLEQSGNSICIEPISKAETVQLLAKNIYRGAFIDGMKMAEEQFNLVLKIANSVPSYSAKRPVDTDSFQSFPEAIMNEICKKNNLRVVLEEI
jgi:hypothetical protein